MAKTSEKMILAKYAEDGYLNFGSNRYTADDRYKAGSMLYTNYILGGGDGVKANDVSKIRVDGGGSGEKSAFCAHHNQLYHWAMKSIPVEFRGIIRLVVIEGLPIKVEGSTIDIKRKLYMARVDLCRGLDRLIEFYRTKHINC
jgi:hypothetical protein